jgi:hypothetical protein
MYLGTKFSWYNRISKNFEFMVEKIRINWATHAISSKRYIYSAMAKPSNWIVLRKNGVNKKKEGFASDMTGRRSEAVRLCRTASQ